MYYTIVLNTWCSITIKIEVEVEQNGQPMLDVSMNSLARAGSGRLG